MTEFIRLNEKNCRDCYKCIRNCLIKAIRYSDGCAQIITRSAFNAANVWSRVRGTGASDMRAPMQSESRFARGGAS